MPPKRGRKRKAPQPKRTPVNAAHDDTDAPLTPPNRQNWPGWVEVESEPAIFNVMLKEMGVRGVNVQEVFSLDENDFLPRPIHALIFLFKYQIGDDEGSGAECPEHVWFANQIPDFACGTVALLNIINNIPGVDMGDELREFRDFTKEMSPLLRGNALDSFDFVRRVHNSFARESDMLHADLLTKEKVDKIKRKQAATKRKEAREAEKLKMTPLKPKSTNIVSTPTPARKSARLGGNSQAEHNMSPNGVASDFETSDGEYRARKKPKLDDTEECNTPTKPVRRSARKPKARKDPNELVENASAESGGFHFIAYVPIQGHVWKLDGMDHFPEDIGEFDEDAGVDWMTVAEPVLRDRMALHEAGGIEFNLMAVVHDPLASSRTELIENIKLIHAIHRKLDKTFNGWRELEGAETPKDLIIGPSDLHEISEADIDGAKTPTETSDKIEKEEDILKLVELHAKIISQQAPLRGAIRDARLGLERDEVEAWHRRYDYGSFVKSWLGALADNQLLSVLLDDS